MSLCHDVSPRRRWYEAYHLQRLLRREARQAQAFKAHFWQAVVAGTLFFWGLVGWGIHSL